MDALGSAGWLAAAGAAAVGTFLAANGLAAWADGRRGSALRARVGAATHPPPAGGAPIPVTIVTGEH